MSNLTLGHASFTPYRVNPIGYINKSQNSQNKHEPNTQCKVAALCKYAQFQDEDDLVICGRNNKNCVAQKYFMSSGYCEIGNSVTIACGKYIPK